MRTRLTLKPGRPGTKKLLAEYGSKLVCVRYRYDEELQTRCKTVELIKRKSPGPTPSLPSPLPTTSFTSKCVSRNRECAKQSSAAAANGTPRPPLGPCATPTPSPSASSGESPASAVARVWVGRVGGGKSVDVLVDGVSAGERAKCKLGARRLWRDRHRRKVRVWPALCRTRSLQITSCEAMSTVELVGTEYLRTLRPPPSRCRRYRRRDQSAVSCISV